MLNKQEKQKIIDKFKVHKNDTGSPQVQIAILSKEIEELTSHLQIHKQDHSSRRGLLKKIGERRRLLKYLQKEDDSAFKDLAKKLKLKIAKKMIDEEEEKKRLEEEMMKSEIIAEEDEEKTDNEDANKKDEEDL
jgi:small subunit ribosomal protein S15